MRRKKEKETKEGVLSRMSTGNIRAIAKVEWGERKFTTFEKGGIREYVHRQVARYRK